MAGEIVPWSPTGSVRAPAAALDEPAWRGPLAAHAGRGRPARIVFRSAEPRRGTAAALGLLALFVTIFCAVLALATVLRLAAGRRRT